MTGQLDHRPLYNYPAQVAWLFAAGLCLECGAQLPKEDRALYCAECRLLPGIEHP